MICNADEGDPGAFMDRSVLESDPHSVLEGMAIAGYAIGATRGYIYVRAEYPLAIERLNIAIAQAEERGFLGDDILGTGFEFHVKLKEGAGAFVCGEETALIASIEGRRGMPRVRPPFPAVKGLWDCPTSINNVETFANVPWIVLNGAQAFNRLGTANSKGTKVFAMAGKIRRGGLVEVPMGISIREIVHDVCGGIKEDRKFKAVQMGGPSGGCIPAELENTVIDYESINKTGAIMGSGGLVVLDETTCMVDVARFFLDFTQRESCGKCTFCRVGTKRMLEILTRITEGKGQEGDIERLENLASLVKSNSLCGLGQTAPNPVLTTLKYFRAEYEAHISNRKCPAHHCQALLTYTINEKCNGCRLCGRACPAKAITGEKQQAARDRPQPVHPVRRVLPGLPLRRHRRGCRRAWNSSSSTSTASGSSPTTGMTILEVARENGIATIPTLCHDGRLEPFASCFVCVVKVKGARTLAAGLLHQGGGGHGGRDRQRRRSGARARRPWSCCSRTTTRTASVPASWPARRGSTSRATSPWPPSDKYRDAIALIKDRNPLPAVCGRVCTRPCEVNGCRRNLLDEAVGIDYIKRYVSDLDLGDKDPWRPALAPPNGKKVAVVGAGPAGLSCAYYLALRGYEVSMFEAQPEAGGMLRYGIPEYRLPKDVLDLEINQILDLGVQLSTNVQLGRDFTVASLKQGGYDAIFLGLGAWDSSKMRVQDEDSPGVLAGIEFLKQFGLTAQGRHPRPGAGGGRRQHRHRLRAHRPAPGRRRRPHPLPAHAQGDARQRDGDRRGRARGREDGLPGRPRAGAPRRGRPGRGGRVHPHGAGRARRERPPQPEARSRLRVPHRLRLRARRHRPGRRACRSSWTGGCPTSSPSASR